MTSSVNVSSATSTSFSASLWKWLSTIARFWARGLYHLFPPALGSGCVGLVGAAVH
jgi:hypothetical protein